MSRTKRSGTGPCSVLLGALILGCGGGPPEGGGASASQASEGATAFVLVLPADAGGPVWVHESDAESQPRWISVHGPRPSDTPVSLRERCAIPDCGGPAWVCGMALPVVRRLAPGDSIRYDWDGRISRTREDGMCEIRPPAEPGVYRAEFCWTAVAPEADADPLQGPGLTGLTCRSRDLELPSTDRVGMVIDP